MKAAALLLVLFRSLNAVALEPPQPDYTSIVVDGRELSLTFEDNFDGTQLDLTKWERCPEWPRQDLNDHWDDSMSWLDGEGNLIIGMDYDEKTDRYLSGGVRSKGIFEQQFGYFEIRCTVNSVPGYWTAFWLMSESVGGETRGGLDGTEIDIYESAYYKQSIIQHTLNWDGYGEAHKAEGVQVKADVYDGEYHTFSCLWTRDEYVFYIDGTETWRTKAEAAGGTSRAESYMKITAEMGSWTKWTDDCIVDPKQLPDTMKVDYVRVYQLND
ncbi:MAG: glycoside hydrolase family 16 protein [Ruminococcaceae bacterium]|nr:glycoside hydrolase family 16 protein [Oscillospiraceae bacterium]